MALLIDYNQAKVGTFTDVLGSSVLLQYYSATSQIAKKKFYVFNIIVPNIETRQNSKDLQRRAIRHYAVFLGIVCLAPAVLLIQLKSLKAKEYHLFSWNLQRPDCVIKIMLMTNDAIYKDLVPEKVVSREIIQFQS